MVPPLEVDLDSIAAVKAEKLRSQIHRARTWQTIERVVNAIDADILLSPSVVEDLKAYAAKRIAVVTKCMVVAKR
jgi:hypothetical protein